MTAVEHRAPRSGTDLAAAMARPETYPDQDGPVEVRETHISWVFLAGDRAYKLKKPVRLPFLDYGTVERRREMCDEEVRLELAARPARLPRGPGRHPDRRRRRARAGARSPRHRLRGRDAPLRRDPHTRAAHRARGRPLPRARRGRPPARRVPRGAPAGRRGRSHDRAQAGARRERRDAPRARPRRGVRAPAGGARSLRGRLPHHASHRTGDPRLCPVTSATATATCAPSTSSSSTASRSSTVSSSTPRCA